jgi:hypothetical protein
MEEDLDVLIQELKALKVREHAIIKSIERLSEERKERQDPDQPTSGKGREESVNGITQGDRVWITNKVKKPAIWLKQTAWIESQFRSATVTSVTNTQIHVLTDNGVRTWRAPNNLRKLNQEH